jgi:diguanylate cyclase (GGDEF)-like protein/PAS domain S-box-containing protein
MRKPLGEEMEFFRQYNEILFKQLEKKILDLETANERLRIMAENYKWQFENISDVVFIIGADLNILNVSPSVEKSMGYKAEDFIGRPVSDLMHILTSESLERAIANLGKLLNGERTPPSIYAFISKDGTLKYAEIQGSSLMLNGQITGTISVARDVTERKFMEAKLLNEENRFRALIEHSLDIIVILNPGGIVTYINPAIEKALGYKVEERIGANVLEVIHPNDLGYLAEKVATLFTDANAPVVQFEMHLHHKDGSWRTFEAVGSNLVHNNVVEAVIVNYRDITERKKVELQKAAALEAFRESEEKYRRIAENMSNMVSDLDAEGLFKYISPSHQRILGYRPEDLLGQAAFDKLHPDDKDQVLSVYMEGVMTKTDHDIEYRYRHADGHYVWIHSSGHIILDGAGEYVGSIINSSDISERKRLEEVLRESAQDWQTTFDATSDAICLLDTDQRILRFNHNMAKLFGVTEKNIGRYCYDVVHGSTEPIPECPIKRMKRSLVREEMEIQKGDRWFNISADPILDETHTIRGVVHIIRDITERKKVDILLQESEKKYRELSIIDDLTQLYNSRHFHAQLEIEVERSNRYGQPLTLLLLDLDKFKKFNDKYGHVEGDEVLTRLGRVIKRCLRDPDSAYRYGGEEFTIMLPMTTSNEGIVTAKRLQTELRKEGFSPVLGQEVYMTVSIGLAQYKPKEDMKEFVHRVDKLMYQAKKDGRDRICADRIGHKKA